MNTTEKLTEIRAQFWCDLVIKLYEKSDNAPVNFMKAESALKEFDKNFLEPVYINANTVAAQNYLLKKSPYDGSSGILGGIA